MKISQSSLTGTLQKKWTWSMKRSVKTRDCRRSWNSGAVVGRQTAHSVAQRSERLKALSPLLARSAASHSVLFAGMMSGCIERQSSVRTFCLGARFKILRSSVNLSYSREPAKTSLSVSRMAPSRKESKTKISKLQLKSLTLTSLRF